MFYFKTQFRNVSIHVTIGKHRELRKREASNDFDQIQLYKTESHEAEVMMDGKLFYDGKAWTGA